MNRSANNRDEERQLNHENIFGHARPREHVLSGRGINYREMEQIRLNKRSDFYHHYNSDAAVTKSWSAGGFRKEFEYEKPTKSEAQPPPPTLTPSTSLSSCCTMTSSCSSPKRADPFAGARPRESVLAERRSSQGSQETSSSQGDAQEMDRKIQRRRKADPFAGARPREAVLADRNKKGKDYNTPWSMQNSNSPIRNNSMGDRFFKKNYQSKPRSSLPTSPPESSSPPTKKKSNPFGDARPREVILAEQGIDYRLVDRARENKLKNSRRSYPSYTHRQQRSVDSTQIS